MNKTIVQNLKINNSYKKVAVRHITAADVSADMTADKGWRAASSDDQWAVAHHKYPSGRVATYTAQSGLFLRYADRGTDSLTRTMCGVNVDRTRVVDAVFVHHA
jgi:uncharacterized protein YfaP (DUF2135 family)